MLGLEVGARSQCMSQVVHILLLRTEKVEGANDWVAGEDKKKSKYNSIYGAKSNHDPDGIYKCSS